MKQPETENSQFETQHSPVLLKEVIEVFSYLSEKESSVFLDGTLGGAGHSLALLENFKDLLLIGLDQDSEAIERAKSILKHEGKRVILLRSNFVHASSLLKQILAEKISAYHDPAYKKDLELFDGILLDIGISSDQLNHETRGFSFRYDAPLDMRMDQTSELTAETVLNTYSYPKLKKVFIEGGMVSKLAGILADKIVKTRPLKTTFDLVSICNSVSELCTNPGREASTVPFQALRIEVNQEYQVLKEFISEAHQLLAPGAKIAVISFHSLEDKIVTSAFRTWEKGEQIPRRIPRVGSNEGIGKLLTKKAILPGEEEIKNNPRARSAMLRVFKRKEEEQNETS